MKEENKIGGHVPLGRPGKPGKITFYFMRSNELSSIKVIIAGKPVKLGDGDAIQVSTELVFSEVEKCIDINKTNKSWNKPVKYIVSLSFHLHSHPFEAYSAFSFRKTPSVWISWLLGD